MQLAICWSGSYHLHLLRRKYNCSSHIVTAFMDVHFSVIHSRTLLENLLSVIVIHSSISSTSLVWDLRCLAFAMNVMNQKTYYLAFAMNATDHINVVLHKFAYSLMSRVVASPNSIVTAIVNSDEYHQSPLMDRWESMLYV